MKINRNICLDSDVYEYLKKIGDRGISSYINKLVRDDIQKNDIKRLSLEEMEKEVRKLEILEEANKKIMELDL